VPILDLDPFPFSIPSGSEDIDSLLSRYGMLVPLLTRRMHDEELDIVRNQADGEGQLRTRATKAQQE
jgi:hypothetical protein